MRVILDTQVATQYKMIYKRLSLDSFIAPSTIARVTSKSTISNEGTQAVRNLCFLLFI